MAQANKRIEDQNSPKGGSLERSLNLAPLALVIDRVWVRWARMRARQMSRALGEALALVCERVEREPGRQADLIAARRRARLDRHRILALRDGEDAPSWTSAELKMLAEADAVEAKAAMAQAVKGKPATAARSRAARLRASVVHERQYRAEARREDLRLGQTIVLDAAREGISEDAVLEIRRGQVTRRLKTRDGLVMLLESGALSPRQVAVGLRYRTWVEITQASLKSCLEVSDREHRPSTLWTQYKAASRRAALANRVREMEIAVSARLHPDALTALRAIAGEARTVNSITTSARRRVRLAEGLGHALDIVGDVLTKGR